MGVSTIFGFENRRWGRFYDFSVRKMEDGGFRNGEGFFGDGGENYSKKPPIFKGLSLRSSKPKDENGGSSKIEGAFED